MPGSHVAITFMSGPMDGKTLQWPFPPAQDAELVLTIGRRESCDIVLNYDTQVSRIHARVVYEPMLNSFYLEDTGSRNGTFLGNNRVDGRALLKPGTLFRVGRTWMRLDPTHLPLEDTARDDTQF